MLSVFLLGLFTCFHFFGIGFGLRMVEFELKFINLQAQQNGNLGPPTQTTQISLGFAYSKKRNQTWSFQNDLNWSSNVFESSFDRVWIEFELIFELSLNWVWIPFVSFALNSMARKTYSGNGDNQVKTQIQLNLRLEVCPPFFLGLFTCFHFVGIGFGLGLKLNLFIYRLSRMEIIAHPPKTP